MTDNRLPKTDVVEALRNGRNSEQSIKAVFWGRMDRDDLTPKENEIFNRIIHLKASIKIFSAEGRYKSTDLVEAHMEAHDISIATAKRDLSLVSELEKALREASLELERSQLYEAAWRGIQLAEEKGDASGMATNGRLAKDLLGLDKEGGTGLINPERIEQHINIIIADRRTTRIMEEMLKNNMSVQKWNMKLEDIMAEEAAETPKDIEYEDVTESSGSSIAEKSD